MSPLQAPHRHKRLYESIDYLHHKEGDSLETLCESRLTAGLAVTMQVLTKTSCKPVA